MEPEKLLPVMLKLLEKLNNPIAVILILAAILAVNGYIFFQQGSTFPEAGTPQQGESPDPASETGPERDPQSGNTPEEPDDAQRQAPEDGQQEPEEQNPEGQEPQEQESEGQESEGQGSQEQEPEKQEADGQGSQGQESEEAERQEQQGPDESNEENEGQASDESPSNNDPQNDSGDGESEDSESGDSESGDSESGDSESGDSQEEESPEQGSGRLPLAGLGAALVECDGNSEGCVRDFVSRVSPESRYIGGRVDLASDDAGQNSRVLYFEDPGMDACQYERGRYQTEDGLDYTVILLGEGSFDAERGEECIPTT